MKKRIYASILSTILSVSLLAGSNNKIDVNNTASKDETYIDNGDINKLLSLIDGNGNVKVPSYYKKIIGEDTNIINLVKLKSLEVTIPINYQVGDLLWLNYCVNLERLSIVTQSDLVLNDIYELPNLYEFKIARGFIKDEAYNLDETLEKKNCSFMYRSNNLKRLKITNFNLEKDFVESLTNLNDLYILTTFDEIITNYDIDYSKLTFLNNLIINRPYSTIIHMSTDEVMELVDNGVNILMYDDTGNLVNIVDLLLESNYMIDKMVSEININYNTNDLDRVRKILYYVLDKLEYDSEIRKELNEGKEHVDVDSFYEMGFLYGALNKNSAICGNYASLFATLCDRFNVSGIVTMSYTHAWNVININDYKCYIDSTVLDNEFENDNDKLIVDSVLINNLLKDAVNIPEEINVDNLKQLSIMSNKYVKNMLVRNGIYSLDIVLLIAFIKLLAEARKDNKRLKRKK